MALWEDPGFDAGRKELIRRNNVDDLKSVLDDLASRGQLYVKNLFQLAKYALAFKLHQTMLWIFEYARDYFGQQFNIYEYIDNEESWPDKADGATKIEDRLGTNILCHCQTTYDVEFCLNMGADPYAEVGVNFTDDGARTRLYPLNYLIMRQRYKAAAALLGNMDEKVEEINIKNWSFFRFINNHFCDAWPLVELLCSKGYTDAPYPYTDRTMSLIEMIVTDRSVLGPTSVACFDALVESQSYPADQGPGAIQPYVYRDNTRRTLLEWTMENPFDRFLPKLFAINKSQIRQDILTEFRRKLNNEAVSIAVATGTFTKDTFGASEMNAKDVEQIFRIAIQTENADLLKALEECKFVFNIVSESNVHYCLRFVHFDDSIVELFLSSTRASFREFFVKYAEMDMYLVDLSEVNLYSMIQRNPYIENSVIKYILSLNQMLFQKGLRERMLPPLHDKMMTMVSFLKRYDLWLLFWEFKILSPVALSGDEKKLVLLALNIRKEYVSVVLDEETAKRMTEYARFKISQNFDGDFGEIIFRINVLSWQFMRNNQQGLAERSMNSFLLGH